jgi:uroporphyrinogen-III synthase
VTVSPTSRSSLPSPFASSTQIRVELVGPGTGAALGSSLLPLLAPGSTLVFACGHDHRPELPQALAEAGHRVVKVTVYAMRPTPVPELPALPPDLAAVVLTSPRAARYYLRGRWDSLPCAHWALGPTTDSAGGPA